MIFYCFTNVKENIERNYVEMKRILLIGSPDLGIAFFKTRTYTEDIKTYVISNREVQIRLGDDIIKIEAANMIIKEFSKEEIDIIGYDEPKIFMLTYDNEDLLLKILSDTEMDKGLFIDDFGTLISLKDFIKKIKK